MNAVVQMNIGKGIKRALLEKNMSQVKLAEKIGVSKVFINRMCNQPNVGMNLVIKISEALDMKPSDLIEMSEM